MLCSIYPDSCPYMYRQVQSNLDELESKQKVSEF